MAHYGRTIEILPQDPSEEIRIGGVQQEIGRLWTQATALCEEVGRQTRTSPAPKKHARGSSTKQSQPKRKLPEPSTTKGRGDGQIQLTGEGLARDVKPEIEQFVMPF